MTVYRFAVRRAISRSSHRRRRITTAPCRLAPRRCRDYIFHPPDIRSVTVRALVIYVNAAMDRNVVRYATARVDFIVPKKICSLFPVLY